MIDLYDDKNEPMIKEQSIIYFLKTPHPVYRDGVSINVTVDDYGLITDVTGWFAGKLVQKMEQMEALEVYKYLVEWELAALRAIGPEDSEYFATKKLSPDYGLDW